MEQYLRVGVISSMHGVKGEVKVFPTTDDVNRFKKLKTVFVDFKKNLLELEINTVKFFKNFVILSFKEYDNINLIEKYKGCDLLVSREDAVPLGPGEYFICDIIGCRVITDEDKQLGVVEDVIQTGANDVYVVRNDDGRDILLPVIDECILDIDVAQRIIKAHIMKGLLDL